jgi:enoyl-CoA hydratase/carnithine racemase
MKAATELAGQILSADQYVVRQMKRLIDLTTRTSLAEGLRIEQDFFKAFNSSDRARQVGSGVDAVMARGRSQTSRQ